MTGFARAEGHDGPLSWAWELKSVNSKSLDLRFRLPPGFDALELPLRALVTQRLKRGSISAGLSVARAAGAGNLRVNREALAVVMRLANELAAEVEAAPPRIDGLLALRGVLESGDEAPDEGARERQMKQLTESFAQALEGLAAMRLSEGARLEAVLTERLDEIAVLVKDAEGAAATQPAAIKARITELITVLLDAVPALPEERLAHEAALVIAKADIREELDRLHAHL
ncbi:MAG TPA: YicC/YloC family endoribonuclease, partial [Stellaceae bacterium]|nr:YicC/YloC family endoribonuclease [Stellaceae bacterium]